MYMLADDAHVIWFGKQRGSTFWKLALDAVKERGDLLHCKGFFEANLVRSEFAAEVYG
jgi:hypothetical protein